MRFKAMKDGETVYSLTIQENESSVSVFLYDHKAKSFHYTGEYADFAEALSKASTYLRQWQIYGGYEVITSTHERLRLSVNE